MANKLDIGQNIEIISGSKSYKSKIENIVDDLTYIIGTPIIHHTYVFIPLNETIKIRYIAKDCIYQFDGKVTHKEMNHTYLLTVTQISPMERIQRRENFRLETAIRATFTNENDDIAHEGIIKDISGGGVRLITSQKLDINERITLNFSLTKIGDFSIKGVVVRSINNNSNYDVGISFKDLNAADREKIVSFIFQEQRKFLKKGLIE
ncbi:MAG: flagellar brake protein [Thermoanaerobacteraceae bacterium]|nr:flagellar brake protein [Thermoanaerobacteraceae bacterium]